LPATPLLGSQLGGNLRLTLLLCRLQAALGGARLAALLPHAEYRLGVATFRQDVAALLCHLRLACLLTAAPLGQRLAVGVRHPVLHRLNGR